MSPETEHQEDQESFSVEWQLGPDEGADPAGVQSSQDEEAKMLEQRLLRLYTIYHPTL